MKNLLAYFRKRRDWNSVKHLNRMDSDSFDVKERILFRGREYVRLWPTGACVTKEFYDYMKSNHE